MPIILDYQLREYIPQNSIEFPITYFQDEIVTLPDWAGPLHWHPDFEISTAECGVLEYQVGGQHIILEALQQISYACGFNSVNYFSRQFKKRFGYAPSQSIDLGK